MRACVTGGAGFIGSRLVDRLLERGDQVVVFDDLSSGTLDRLDLTHPNVRFLDGDTRDSAAVEQALRGCDVVFHQAALGSVQRSVADPREVFDVNVGGTLTVLLAVRAVGLPRVVFASSSSVYGDTPVLPKIESMAPSPRSPYAASKLAGEGIVSAFAAAYGIETVALRYFNVYGPGQSPRSSYAAVIPLFIDAVLSGRSPLIHGDGRQTRDFTFIDDVVEANLLAASAPDPQGTVINIGAGGRTAIFDLARAVADLVGFAGDPVTGDARPGDVRDSMADIKRASDLLGWRPSTPLRSGLEQTIKAIMRGQA